MSYILDTIKQIEEKDSKDSRFDIDHYLSVARICKCKNCYSCAVQIWKHEQVMKQYTRGDNVI